MFTITLETTERIDSPERQKKEWGDRLFASYLLSGKLNNAKFQFIWVMAGTDLKTLCPEYDDDFDRFLEELYDGSSFRKNRGLINEIQEKFAQVVHYTHSGDTDIAIQLPLHITQDV